MDEERFSLAGEVARAHGQFYAFCQNNISIPLVSPHHDGEYFGTVAEDVKSH